MSANVINSPVAGGEHARGGMHINRAAATELPAGFLDVLLPLHEKCTPWQQSLVERRRQVLEASHSGRRREHLPASRATEAKWRIELPAYIQDQRNQMTGPADDAELVVKMLNSGAPGVMLDLEDSTANYWENSVQGIGNILEALRGKLTYFDQKRNQTVSIRESSTVIWTRPRGLHLNQAGVPPDRAE